MDKQSSKVDIKNILADFLSWVDENFEYSSFYTVEDDCRIHFEEVIRQYINRIENVGRKEA